MADDVAVTAGSGTAIATQDRSSRHFQQVIPAGASTIVSGRVTVTTAAGVAIAARANRVGVQLLALSSNTAVIDIGDSGTASGADFPLEPGAYFYLPYDGDIYADSASGSQVLAYVEFYD